MEVPDTLVSAANGCDYSLWDVEVFYRHSKVLPDRQFQSIRWYLYENMLESDAALRMGIAESNPVGTYATIGLTALLTLAVSNGLPGYVIELDREVVHA